MQVGQTPQQATGVASSQRVRNGNSPISFKRSTAYKHTLWASAFNQPLLLASIAFRSRRL